MLLIASLLLACLLCVVVALVAPPRMADVQPTTSSPGTREALGYTIRQEKESLQRPQVFPSGHFYDGPVRVELRSGLSAARIHYTLDGSTPTEKSPRYTGSFLLAPEDGTGCVVLKAAAFVDGQSGAVTVHSYFFDAAIRVRRSAYVFSLSGDTADLFGYDRGILVPGRISNTKRAHSEDPEKVYANYREHGRDWERPVDVEVFSADGDRLLLQRGGIRVSGGGSRAYQQKSLRLIARKAYDPKRGRFSYPFFPDLAAADARPPLLSFKNLILSNSGELMYAQTRTPLLKLLAMRAGYRWTTPTSAAAVYINGQYYGFAWLTTRLDAHQLGDIFDRPEEDFVVLDADAASVRSSPRYPYLLHWRMINKLNAILEDCRQETTDEALYEALQKQIDVRNALLYHAIQIYIDNRDWPDFNLKIWRYAGTDAEGVRELDGRWRYVLFDLDATAMTPWKGKKPESNPTLARLLTESPLLAALLRRKDLAAQFANDMCDMAFVHFSETAVRTAFDELDAMRGTEMRHAARHGVYNPPDRLEKIEQGRRDILRFFHERPQHALDELRRHLGFTQLYHVRVEGMARLNTLGPANPEGWYFVENPVTVVPELPPEKHFLRWEVNGSPREDEMLTLTAADAIDGDVRVRLVTRDAPVPLVFEQLFDHGATCGFSLRNRSNAAVSVEGLFLSDNPGKLRKYALPSMTVLPGEALAFVGKDARHASALGKLKLNFNPRRGERIFLRDREGRLLSSASVD